MLQSRGRLVYRLVVFTQLLIILAIIIRYSSERKPDYIPSLATPNKDRLDQRDVPKFSLHRLEEPMAAISASRQRLGCRDYQDEKTVRRPARISYEYMKPPPFLPDYKNPCWWSDSQHKNLSCFPYFYIAGVQKCGTTDLAVRVSQHPLVVKGKEKEPRYLNRRMFDSDCLNRHSSYKDKTRCILQNYAATYFDIATQSIQRNRKYIWTNRIPEPFKDEWKKMQQQAGRGGRHQMITFDATAKTLVDDRRWQQILENKGCPEPVVLLPHMVSRLNPHAKIIVLFRDPTDRLLSDYVYFNDPKTISPENFHKRAAAEIAELKECEEEKPYRLCLIQFENKTSTMLVGLYHKYLEEWFHHFPTSQFLFIQSESYKNDIGGTLEKVFRFLDLPPLSEEAMNVISSLEQKNTNKLDKQKKISMLPKTRVLLKEFYREYNERLAEMLNDERFAWRDKAE